MDEQMSFFESKDIDSNGNKSKTIISASRRTDLPVFYYEWLQNALANRIVQIPNPMYPNQIYSIDLSPETIHSIVLWSKNFENVLKNPGYLVNYNLYFQYTINNYSKLLEPNVPLYQETIHTLDGLLAHYKPEQFNIRFDPILISTQGEITPTAIPEKARLIAFESLCKDLKSMGMEKCRVTTSYIALYKHVIKNLDKDCIDYVSLNEKEQVRFFTAMVEISDKYGISLFSCASPILEQVKGIHKGHCIDGYLLETLFGGKVSKSKDKGQRESCGCTYSRDIGIYSKSNNGMKCLHGCRYCYVA